MVTHADFPSFSYYFACLHTPHRPPPRKASAREDNDSARGERFQISSKGMGRIKRANVALHDPPYPYSQKQSWTARTQKFAQLSTRSPRHRSRPPAKPTSCAPSGGRRAHLAAQRAEINSPPAPGGSQQKQKGQPQASRLCFLGAGMYVMRRATGPRADQRGGRNTSMRRIGAIVAMCLGVRNMPVPCARQRSWAGRAARWAFAVPPSAGPRHLVSASANTMAQRARVGYTGEACAVGLGPRIRESPSYTAPM
jgi:hypothetical protein